MRQLLPPMDDPTGEIREASNVFAVVGSSQRWAVWGERWWELALVWATAHGAWLEVEEVAFLDRAPAMEAFAGYGSSGTLWDPAEVETFVRNVDRFNDKGRANRAAFYSR
jgi:hypothetical protein